jgi:hypothetical protein
MVEGAFDRRVTKLEGDMVDLGKCVVRLETLQEGAAEDYKNLSKKQDEMLDGIAAVHNTVNGKIKEPVTFKWILEKIALPILLGGGSVAVTIYAVLKMLSG